MKMRRLKFKTNLTFIAVLLSVSMLAAGAKEYKKEMSREFNINSNGVVEIVNKYGNIDVHAWDQSTVKIDVVITVDAKNEEKANQTLDRIKIEFDESSARARAITEINTIKNWKRWFGNKSDKFQIDYDVYMPNSMELDLDNKYGDIYVPQMDNRVEINLKYGNFQIEEVNGDADISMGYAKGRLAGAQDVDLNMSYSTLRCGVLGDVSIDSKYGRFEADALRNLRSNSSYDDYKIDAAESITNSGKYDDLILGQVGSLDVNTKYTDIEVQQLDHEANLDMKYGGAKLYNIQPGFSSIDIDTEYANIVVDTDASANFVLEAYTKYCGVKDSGLEVYHDQRKHSETTLKGYRGSREASARITANMQYGSLTIR